MNTTYESPTALSAEIPASDLSAPGMGMVTVVNSPPGGGASVALPFTVGNPVPVLTSISPTTAISRGAAFTLTVTGTNFVSGSQIQWNGSALTTTYVSATNLTAQVPAADLTGVGTFNVSVANPSPGGGTSSTASFNVVNPAPVLTSLSPTTATVGGPALTLTLTGSNFVSGSQIQWNGSALTTTYVSATSLTAQVPATDLTGVGTFNVSVANPSPGGGTSSTKSFNVVNPAPVLTSLSPTTATVGGPALTLTLTGSNFVSGSQIQWNGSALTTTYVSATSLTAQVPATDLTGVGTFTISVTNPSPGGGTSITASFNVVDPSPVLTSLSPTTATVGGAAFTLTVTGTNFVSGSQIQWNGSALTTTYVSATSLTAQVPATDLTGVGTFNISVTNPSPGGGTSSTASFNVVDPSPVLTSLSPTTATVGGAAFTLTVTGTNFISGSQIQWNGSALTTTYVSATSLNAQISASLLASTPASFINVSVTNPSPGGGTSDSVIFAVVASANSVAATTVTSLNLPINHLVWDAAHASLYATLGNSGTNANTVVAINPATATVGTPQPAGNNPDVLALAQDGSFLYSATASTGQIERFNLPSLTLDPSLNLQLPVSPIFGQQSALSLAVAPGTPHTFAVILSNPQWTPSNTGGTVVYDDATPRPKQITYFNEGDTSLAWNSSATVLYSNDGDTTGYDLFVNAISSSGASLSSDYGYLVPEQYARIYYDGTSGHIYSDGGRVVDPTTGNLVGTFNLPANASFLAWLCAPDLANGRVFFLGQTSAQISAAMGVTIEVFDASTYQLLSTLTLPDAAGSSLVDFVRWGNAGLAFTMGPGTQLSPTPRANTLYLLDGGFVSATATPDFTGGSPAPPLPRLTSIAPQTAAAGASALTLMVQGADFGNLSRVSWNGAALETTYVNSSLLQAVVPASNLATAGSALVTVSDGATLAAQTSLAFVITPATGTTELKAFNLAALDVAWDAAGSHLILPVWSADSQYPNSILAIDPASGAVVHDELVSTDPDLVRITSDNGFVYTAYGKNNLATKLNLPNLNSPSSFTLGADSFYGPYFAIDLQPAPGEDGTTAVAFGVEGAIPDESGIGIFDNGMERPTAAPGFGSRGYQYDFLQWGSSDSVLYATDRSENSDNLYSFTVGSSGISLSSEYNTIGATPIHFDAGTGLIYANSGQVLNPDTMNVLGSYNASGILAVDSKLQRVFILGQTTAQSGTTSYTIQSFDQTRFTAISSIVLPSVVGTPVAMTRWGVNGLAFVTYNKDAGATGGPAGVLYILSDVGFVSANARFPQTVPQMQSVHAAPLAWPFNPPVSRRQPLTNQKQRRRTLP